MAAPLFLVAQLTDNTITLDEDTSKHMINVLRMQQGEEVLLTDGKGTKATAAIIADNRKKTIVEVIQKEIHEPPNNKVTIAISLIKNSSRFEWFLEKATEIGVTEIIPLICARTEKEKFRFDRMQNILISAMLQSQQYWLPVLHEPLPFEKAITFSYDQKFIAHCEESKKSNLNSVQLITGASQLMLIGPEGDFAHEEIEAALNKGFTPVALGKTRLRTETAGVVAATLLCVR